MYTHISAVGGVTTLVSCVRNVNLFVSFSFAAKINSLGTSYCNAKGYVINCWL